MPEFAVMSELDENILLTKAKSRIGTVIGGRYTIDDVLGVGGMATVFAATERDGRRYALKLLHAELAGQETVRKRFVREGGAANSVDHDGVVGVIDHDVDESGLPFLIMELLEGASVKTLCEAPTGGLSVRETLCIVGQILDVLSAAHGQGIVHRDVKPSNLFITTDGAVKVLDFGIAQLRESTYEQTLTKTGHSLGTPSFMAPEQALAKSGEVDERTDIWAVGATMFTMLSGRFVHEGENPSHIRALAVTNPAPKLVSVAPDVPFPIAEIVDRALAFEKESRFESAVAMRDAVEKVLIDFYGGCTNDVLALLAQQRSGANGSGSRSAVSRVKKPRPTEIDDSRDEMTYRPSNGSVSLHSSGATSLPAPERSRRELLRGYWWAALPVVLGILAIVAWRKGWFGTPTEGTVTASVTTDLLVPNDFDWVSYKVTSENGKKLIDSDEVSVSHWTELPIRFEIPGAEAEGLLQIEIAARRGGKAGKIILERALQFQIPKEGEQILEIPLDLLCTEDASTTHCKVGQQCRAGECVDIALSPFSPVYSDALDSPKCFQVAQCFASGFQITIPNNFPDIGTCAIKGSPSIYYGENQNIGLVVNRLDVGDYGVCDEPYGRCIIPLDRGPEGWQVVRKSGKVVGIRLPDAVCKGISMNRLSGVAVAPATPGCPAKSADIPLCPEPDVCVIKEGICPSDFPSAWIGYECSGAASPQMIRPDLNACFLPQMTASTPADKIASSGQWCCSAGEESSDNPLLIDDMRGGPQIKLSLPEDEVFGSNRYVGGFWWTASDAIDGEFTPGLTPQLFTYRPLPSPVKMTGKRSFDRAACFKSSGFSGWYALMGFGFRTERGNSVALTLDVSRYKGIRFWGYSPNREQRIAVRFPDHNTYTEDPGSTCNRNPRLGKCGEDFGVYGLILTPEWKEYKIEWADVTQSSNNWGQARFDAFDKTRVYHTQFSIFGRGPEQKAPPFEFCISQVSFIR